MENLYDTWKDTVERTARWVARDFPDVEVDDLTQDLYVTILERGWDDPTDKSVLTILRRVAKGKAAEYRAQHLSLTSQYAYRTSEIRTVLGKVFSYEDWPQRSVMTASDRYGREIPQWGLMDHEDIDGADYLGGGYGRQGRVVAGGDDGSTVLVGQVSGPALDWEDRMAAFCDVSQAWQRLPKEYRKVIFQRFALGEEFERNSADERRLSRAVARLTDVINSYYRSPVT